MAAGGPSPQRLLAAVVYLPIDLGAKAVEELPDAVARARRELTVARFFGKMVVDRTVAELKDRVAGTTNASAGPAPSPPATGSGPEPHRSDDPAVERRGPTPPATASSVPSADELALPDYDQLPAAHILGKLGGLTPDEREAIRRYETAHRHRRTVIGKLEQLAAAGAS